MLPAGGGDPEVVGGDGFADAPEFENDLGIVMRGRFLMSRTEAIVEQAREPIFVGGAGGATGRFRSGIRRAQSTGIATCSARARMAKHGGTASAAAR